jgi:hypothetical protein
MDKAFLILRDKGETRAKAAAWCGRLPDGTRVTFAGPKRTLPQNDRMWAMLTDVSEQATHHGLKLTPTDWKHLFTAALRRELRMVPNLTGDGFVQLGGRTSEMTTREMRDLIELIQAWGAQNGVRFADEREQAA